MSNIAGKAFAMNLITPLTIPTAWLNTQILKAIQGNWIGKLFRAPKRLTGLQTLSMIHYARWVIVKPHEWPHLGKGQPKEDLHYAYQLFFSNFNGSWAQYVDSFSVAIPDGLNALWRKNVGWPTSVPERPFHRYVQHNQVWTNHYYSAYPIAASNDVKSAQRLKDELLRFIQNTENMNADEFKREYDKLLNSLQGSVHGDVKNDKFPCLGELAPTPIVSLASEAVAERRRNDEEISHAK